MLDLNKNSGPKPRCLVTNTQLSNFLNHEQPPTKKRPFSTILNQTFTHSLTLILPTQSFLTSPFQNALSTINSPYTLHYAKAHFKLAELLKNPFFTTYLKSPPTSLLLISTPSSNPYSGLFTLSEGILRLTLDRPTYERTGLEGKAIDSPGRKHAKDRFLVEINLRLPSMLHGKKGFERIVWAFENVLNETCTWLIADEKSGGFESLLLDANAPIHGFAPLARAVQADVTKLRNILVPAFPESGAIKEEDYAEAEEILEWLGLVMLDSPRIRKDDEVSKHLSRYQVPEAFGEAKVQDVSTFRWRGLVPAEFAYKTFLAALKASGEDWVGMSASSLEGETFTILVRKGQVTIWEYKD